MRPLIVYQSRTGNTRLVVDTIASVLDADVMEVERTTSNDFKDRLLVGFGSGIYWTRIDPKIYEAASFLDPRCRVFVFITSGFDFPLMLRLYWFFIRGRLDRLGVQLAGEWDCRGHDKYPLLKWTGLSKGHPSAVDIENARKFAHAMKVHA